MDLRRFLKTGGRARISAGGKVFQTIINEVSNSETLSLMIPGGYRPEQGSGISVTCVTDIGLCVFDTRISGVEQEDQVGVMTLQVEGPINRIQKRDAYRSRISLEVLIKIDPEAPELTPEDILPKTWEGKYRQMKSSAMVPEGWLKTYTLNISETGMLVRMEDGTRLRDPLSLVIKIKHHGIHEVLTGIKGKLARSFEAGHKDTDLFVGIQFVELPERARNILMKLVFQCQRAQMDR